MWDGNDLKDVKSIALAIATTGNYISTLDVIWLTAVELKEDGIVWNSSKGRTALQDIADRHVDVCRLDYCRIGVLARHIRKALESNRTKRLSKNKLIALLKTAANSGRLDSRKLEPDVCKHLKPS